MSSQPELGNVVVVDDDASKRYVFAHALRRAGFVVDEAADGANALRLARERPPDLMLLDVRLPDLSGFEVARRIKADAETRHIVVVHLSAVETEVASRVRGIEEGADAYFTLPVEPAEVVANVKALVRLRRECQVAIDAREDFLAMAAHELRTPLTALMLSVQYLIKSRRDGAPMEPEAEHRLLDRVGRQLHRMTRLVNALLDVSRLSKGRLELARERVNLSTLVSEALQDFPRHAARVRPAIEPDVYVDGDPARLDEVITNLVSNAFKYGGEGPVEVALSAADGGVRLSVQDHGPGIDPGDQERIFRRFERATRRREGDSLGLGLYVVREIVRGHGGEVTLRSAVGQGATFTVTLPAAREAEPAAGEPSNPET